MTATMLPAVRARSVARSLRRGLYRLALPAPQPAERRITVPVSGCRSPRTRPNRCECGQFPSSLHPFGRRPSPGESGPRPPRRGIHVHSRRPRNHCRRRRRWRNLGRRPWPRRSTQGRGKGCWHARLPAVRERTIGSLGGLARIAAMPKRPGQLNKGADPDVLPVVQGGIAMLVGPMHRRGCFRNAQGLHGNRRYRTRIERGCDGPSGAGRTRVAMGRKTGTRWHARARPQ